MALKKSQLYSTLWESCNTLRGSMDASQYKDYVLMVLFIKYLSDKDSPDSDFTIPEGCRFSDFVALKGNAHIGEEINKKFERIKEENAWIIGDLTLPNFNDPTKLGEGRTMVDTLSKLIGVFENDALDFSKNRAADDDLLGDAYEYLMKNFAAESGKSKGQFYTPAEVSRIIAMVLEMGEFERASNTIYDPACGSGSLLLRALGETPRQNLSIYGQEKDATTASLAKLNMLLHGITTAEIKVGDTLNDPKFKSSTHLKTFDIGVANPPFSMKNWLGDAGESDIYNRWNPTLLPPEKNGDYAFLLHLVRSLKDDPGHEGRCACILPHGVLFRGNAEYVIRRDLIVRNLIKGIIGLPPNLFFGTGIPASIILIDKRGTKERKGVFFIDAKDGFMKDGAKNRLREQDIRRIVDTWRGQKEIPHYSRLATWDEIARNDFNLNIPRYVEARDTGVKHNLDGHLRGGISDEEIDAFATEWQSFPEMKARLFKPLRKGFSVLKVPTAEISPLLEASDSAAKVRAGLADFFSKWAAFARSSIMQDLARKPKTTIELLGTEMLKDSGSVSAVIDPYDVYGALMDYINETMRDDLYILNSDGWLAGRETVVTKKTKTSKEWDGLLFPKALVSNRYFPDLVEAVKAAVEAAEAASAQFDLFLEAETERGEDSDIMEADGDDWNVMPDKELKKKLKASETVRQYFALKKAKSDAAAHERAEEKKLDAATEATFAELSEAEIQTLLFDDKWFAALEKSIMGLFDSALRKFAAGLSDLALRYGETLSELEAKVAKSQNDVHAVLREMGFNW
ncbi:MAG: SAM-dependent DNA methyltransferase [Kiritimatiellae bacterium]|nr:SAM-dependent DNA methyltransferase [Kiritimatiellia bacterium]